MGEITIPRDEYKNLIRMEMRLEAFANYVNSEKYSIGREMCAKMLGFELEKKEDGTND